MELTEKIVLKNLILNPNYFLKVYPFIEESLFSERITQKLFKAISAYNNKYNRQANLPVINVFIESIKGVSDTEYKALKELEQYFHANETFADDWLFDETESWIQKRKYYESLIGAAEKFEKGELDTTLTDKIDAALSITFDNNIGMEFSEAEDRWESYISEESHIPFLLDEFNAITNGGVCPKTLNCLLSSDSGGFKSGTLCHLSADYIRSGKNVLYITLEMAEDKILERIDANMLDVEIDNLVGLGKETFIRSIDECKRKIQGRLIVKQFPTTVAHVGHIRYLLKELKLKRNFIPDIICVDYLNLMASLRLKAADSGNSYGYIKAITEELRGLAIEQDIAIWTATQSNRGGAENENLSVTDISESYGTLFSLDVLIGIITTEEFDAQNKILYKQLKNRYADKNKMNKFFLGVNKAKMTLYSQMQRGISPDNKQEKLEDEQNAMMFKGKKNKFDNFNF